MSMTLLITRKGLNQFFFTRIFSQFDRLIGAIVVKSNATNKLFCISISLDCTLKDFEFNLETRILFNSKKKKKGESFQPFNILYLIHFGKFLTPTIDLLAYFFE